MLTITNATVSRDEVWCAYRHTHDVPHINGLILCTGGLMLPLRGLVTRRADIIGIQSVYFRIRVKDVLTRFETRHDTPRNTALSVPNYCMSLAELSA